MNTKELLRKKYKYIRSELSQERRSTAAAQCFSFLLDHMPHNAHILSFANSASEIDMTSLNTWLKQQGKLYLTKTHQDHLEIFHVDKNDPLPRSPMGIQDPTPGISHKVSIADIDLFLVPGICFDKNNHRIGYGRGYIDRLIALIQREKPQISCWGVGFLEQRCQEMIPSEPHDMRLDHVFLF